MKDLASPESGDAARKSAYDRGSHTRLYRLSNRLIEIGVRQKSNPHDRRRVQLIAGPVQPFAKIRWQRFGVTFSFRPLLVLADHVGIDGSLVRQVIRDGAIDLFEPKKLEILANRLRRLAAAECMND